MMEQYFRFLPGIGARKEAELQQTVGTWDQFLSAKHVPGISSARKPYYDRKIREARCAKREEDVGYFMRTFPQRDMHLLYPWLRDDALFLDIETSGINGRTFITIVGMYDGTDTKTLIHSMNLDPDLLRKEIKKHKLLVTFNGACFDVPMLEKFFPGACEGVAHFDVRFACQQIGLFGGLKQIEHTLGLRRPKIVDGMHGGDAYTLWRMFHASRDPYYLELLVEYNTEDVVNLQPLADHVCRKMGERMNP